jgi:hypothetical protein
MSKFDFQNSQEGSMVGWLDDLEEKLKGDSQKYVSWLIVKAGHNFLYSLVRDTRSSTWQTK